MVRLKSVGIKELKAKLSAYLRDVRAGEHLLVTDRDEVIAEIRRPSESIPMGTPAFHPTLQEWADLGLLHFPTARRTHVAASPIRVAAATAEELIDADRSE